MVGHSQIFLDFIELLSVNGLNRVHLKKLTDECLEKLKEEGMTVTTPPLDEFKSATRCITENFKDALLK